MNLRLQLGAPVNQRKFLVEETHQDTVTTVEKDSKVKEQEQDEQFLSGLNEDRLLFI